MPACAASKTIADQATIRNLFLPLPDTDFREHLAEVDDLAQFAPEIITAITADLDLHARQKKSLRLVDRKFFESRTRDIPCLARGARDSNRGFSTGRWPSADPGQGRSYVSDAARVSRFAKRAAGRLRLARVDQHVCLASGTWT